LDVRSARLVGGANYRAIDRLRAGAAKVDAVMRLSPAFAGLILAGCSLGADPAPIAQLDTLNVPNIEALAPKIRDTFKGVKLVGSPQVSPVRRAPVSALGDWIVCLRGDVEGKFRVYALIIENNEIVDYRLALIVDGCANESFAPLPLPPQTASSTLPPTKPIPSSKKK
jgi:hypothetical protein